MNLLSKCPKCQSEMENGAIISSRNMFWGNPEKNRPFYILPTSDSEFHLTNSLSINKLKGRICKNCKIIIVEYEDG